MFIFSEQIIRRAIWTIFLKNFIIHNVETQNKISNIRRRFSLFFITIMFKTINGDNLDYLTNIENEYINVTKNQKMIMKSFSFVEYNMKTDYLKNIMEKIVFKEDIETSLIAGGYFSNYGRNYLTFEFNRLYSMLNKQRDVDIYIETNSITKYRQKYKRKTFKNVKKYPLSFYTMKLVWQGININLIFSGKNISNKNMYMINNFDFDFCKIFYSYQKNSIYAHYRLFECFDQINQNYNLKIASNYLNYYEQTLLANMTLNPQISQFSKDFVRYNLVRYIKYAFKGFYVQNEEENVKKIICFYEHVLIKFFK